MSGRATRHRIVQRTEISFQVSSVRVCFHCRSGNPIRTAHSALIRKALFVAKLLASTRAITPRARAHMGGRLLMISDYVLISVCPPPPPHTPSTGKKLHIHTAAQLLHYYQSGQFVPVHLPCLFGQHITRFRNLYPPFPRTHAAQSIKSISNAIHVASINICA